LYLTKKKIALPHALAMRSICQNCSKCVLSYVSAVRYSIQPHCSKNSSIEDGRVYSFGCNSNGQLGLDHLQTEFAPKEIDFFRDKSIDKIYAGGHDEYSFHSRLQVHFFQFCSQINKTIRICGHGDIIKTVS
jgi:alpha-tubulin suppressor-like RCC1 family protein